MAYKKQATRVPGFAEIAHALQAIPEEAEKWTKSAQRETWKEFQTSTTAPGLVDRFDQTIDKMGSARPGKFLQAGLGFYQWSARRRMIPKRQYRHNGHTSSKPQQAAFVRSGAMRAELLKRRAKTRSSGGQVRTTMSIYHRSQNLWGRQRGVARMDVVQEWKTYLMTVYKGPGGAADKAGPVKEWVSRLVDKTIVSPAVQTYAEEWQFKPKEIAHFKERAEHFLRQRVRKAVFDKKGNLRSKYRSRLSPAVTAA